MDFNAQGLLNQVGQSFTYYAPIRDALLQVDDGSEQEVDMLLDALNFRTEDERIRDMLQNVQMRVDEATENVERRMEENEYIIRAEPTEVAKMVIAAGDNLVPIRNEIIGTDVGEDAEYDELESLFESESIENEDDFGDLSKLIADITATLEDV